MSWGVATQNGVSVSLASIVSLSAGVTEFSPADLFTGGVQGAWYDPSDYSTLFQDSAGTTPVTAVEQPVGLMLDKSQGLVLGSELVTNGGPGFTTTTGWGTSNATVAASGGKLVCAKTGSSSAVYWTLTTVVGTWYKVDIVWENVDATSPSILVNSSGGLSITTTNTTATVYFIAAATTTFVQMQLGSGAIGTSTRIISLSTKTISGNHASQATAASRPVLRARYNLLTYSEQFDNAFWKAYSASTVTANSAVAPNGTLTADRVAANANATNNGAFENTVGFSANDVFSVYAKADTVNWLAVGTANLSPYAWFNLASGTVGPVTGCTASITPVGDGWYRCVVNFTVSGTRILLAPKPSSAVGDPWSVVTNSIGDSIYLWGAQLTQPAVFPSNTYQRIAAATDYATAGFLPYLAFDGTDDSFGTNSINFTATDKMSVCAGVTKLSDAARAALVETSSAGLAGSFLLEAPDTAAARYGMRLRGDGAAAVQVVTPSNFAAPITNVLAAFYDIAGINALAEMTMRVNTVALSMIDVSGGGNAGGGNFGNYPLYIGRRNNASLPFNGRIYQLIVCGKTLSASELASTEAYVNARTGAY